MKNIELSRKDISIILVLGSLIFTLGYNIKSNTTVSERNEKTSIELKKEIKELKKLYNQDRLNLENRITKIETK